MNSIQSQNHQNNAIESLIEMGDSGYLEDDWQKTTNQKSNKAKTKFLNFIKQNKESNSSFDFQQQFTQHHSGNTSPINQNKLYNRFRRANSLFDGHKFPKETSIVFQYEPLLPTKQADYIEKLLKEKIIVNESPEKMKENTLKKGKANKSAVKRQPLLLQNHKFPSKQLLDGETVMIKVQSYQEGLNRKQLQYLMNKTVGSKQFYPNIEEPSENGNGKEKRQRYSKDSLRKNNARFYASTGSKHLSRNSNTRLAESSNFSNKNSKSLDNSTKNSKNQRDHISVSIRHLLNNLQTKSKANGSSSMAQFDKAIKQEAYRNSKIQQQSAGFNGITSTSYRNLDKDKLLKIYEEEQMKLLKCVKEKEADLGISNIVSPSQNPIIFSPVKKGIQLEQMFYHKRSRSPYTKKQHSQIKKMCKGEVLIATKTSKDKTESRREVKRQTFGPKIPFIKKNQSPKKEKQIQNIFQITKLN